MEPMAFKCRLGWSAGGPTSSQWRGQEINFHICESVNMGEVLHQMVKDSFTTEDFGVKPLFQKLRSEEDERAMDVMKSTTLRVSEESFETELLRKDPTVKLPESYSNAFNRLKCQERVKSSMQLIVENLKNTWRRTS